MHFSGSMTYLSSPSEIASTGHSPSHIPQEMQASVILYAISSPFMLTSTALYPAFAQPSITFLGDPFRGSCVEILPSSPCGFAPDAQLFGVSAGVGIQACFRGEQIESRGFRP